VTAKEALCALGLFCAHSAQWPASDGRSSSTLEGMQQLSATFEEAGFLVIPDALTESCCSDLDAHVRSLDSIGSGTRELLGFDWACQLARQLRDLPLIRAILGDSRLAVQCTYFAKRPSRNWLVAPHQDLSIPVMERKADARFTGRSEKDGTWFCQPPSEVLSQLVAVPVHLDNNIEGNGPLRVIPGSHRLGRIAVQQIAETRRQFGEVRCLVARRGIVAMRPLLLHASSKSTVDTPRRVLHVLFGARTYRQASGGSMPSNHALQASPRHCFACRGSLAREASLGAPERER
jgi:hypothetical protein